MLFDGLEIGGLALRNRVMRSATAERLGDQATGAPAPRLAGIYRKLAEGGVGLIVTGHCYVERVGKGHPQMSAIDKDELIPLWREIIRPAQAAGAKVMMQINHAGSSVDPAITPHPLSPSGAATNESIQPGIMTTEDLERIVRAFGQAARRAREAGCDGVQIHGAHGYLVTQTLSEALNTRSDCWGGALAGRMTFLRRVVQEMQAQAGADFPLWLKLGVAGKASSGLSMQQGGQVVAACASWGVGCVEVSHGWGIPESVPERGEGRFIEMAKAAREAVGANYPLALVGGFASREAMERTLADGVVQLISLCRPLILEPDLVARLESGAADRARCVRCDQCWPKEAGDWCRCHHPRLGSV